MLKRRDFMLASLAATLWPGTLAAAMRTDKPLSWAHYQAAIRQLASAYADRNITQAAMAAQGVQLLEQLDTADPAFLSAALAAYESGNRFWLWQRLSSANDVKGGILTIELGEDVPLHDHPGATGMLRVLTGVLEVWQFDRPQPGPAALADGQAVLERVTHRVMHPGDIAVVSPGNGNIHALRARSKECSMLDYFIPPYVRSERTWYRPVDDNWHDAARVSCRCIAENDYYMS